MQYFQLSLPLLPMTKCIFNGHWQRGFRFATLPIAWQIQTFMSFQNSSQCSTKHVWEDLRIQTFVLVLVVNLILVDCGGGFFLLFCSPHVYSARFCNQMWLSFHTGSNDSSGNENPHPLIREAKNGTGSTSSTRS